MISEQQYNEMLLRLRPSTESKHPVFDAVDEEIPLHGEIMKWCKAQHPIVPFVHANPYQKSRVTPGVTDFIIGYRGKTFWIEVKDKDGKQSTVQLGFALLLELQGIKAHVVRSMSEFLSVMESPHTTQKTL